MPKVTERPLALHASSVVFCCFRPIGSGNKSRHGIHDISFHGGANIHGGGIGDMGVSTSEAPAKEAGAGILHFHSGWREQHIPDLLLARMVAPRYHAFDNMFLICWLNRTLVMYVGPSDVAPKMFANNPRRHAK